MIVLYAIVLIFIVIVVVVRAYPNLFVSIMKAKSAPPVKEKAMRSKAANKIIEAFNALPESNRPAYDVVPLMEALDIKHQISYVDNHFQNTPNYGAWCRCYRDKAKNCPYAQYYNVFSAIHDITRELGRREAALERKSRQDVLAGLMPTLNDLDALTDALRVEKTIINEVTRDYV